VTLRVIQAPGGGVLEVEDDGPGIPREERNRVFDRFYRLARRENPEGSGLGLAIVRAVADRLGAIIELADAPGPAGLLARVRFRPSAPVDRMRSSDSTGARPPD
jgi:two-component system sensor histidine kinase TctE